MFDASGQLVHFGLARTTDAAAEPLTTAEAKLFLRVDSSTDDALIDVLVKAARQRVEQDTGRALISQTWTFSLDSAPSGGRPIVLPINPVASVTSITSYDTADASSVLSSSVYRLDAASSPARIVLRDGQSWPSGLRPQTGVVVVFVAGYGASSSSVTDVGLIQAVRMLVEHWYAQRDLVATATVVANVPMTYQYLIEPLIVRGGV